MTPRDPSKARIHSQIPGTNLTATGAELGAFFKALIFWVPLSPETAAKS